MSGAPAIVHSAREQWLARRRALVTASDAAAILGEDDRRGPLQVWLSKVHGVEAEDNIVMRRGRRFEAAIAEEYADQTGRIVADVPEFEIAVHPELPWLGATLDRKVLATEAMPDPFGGIDWTDKVRAERLRVDGVRAPLQIKMAIGSASKWKDEPPTGYAIQVAIETACVGAAWGALCGLVGVGPLKTFDLPRNDAFLAAALPHLEAFWQRVVRKEPPPADGLPGTTEAVRIAFADEDGTTVDLGADAQEVVEQWEAAKRRASAAETTVAEIENRLRVQLGNASFGKLEDGSYLTLKTTKRKAYTVEATSYRALRRWWPRVRRG